MGRKMSRRQLLYHRAGLIVALGLSVYCVARWSQVDARITALRVDLAALEEAEQGRVGLASVLGTYTLDRALLESELMRTQLPLLKQTIAKDLDPAGHTKALEAHKSNLRAAAMAAKMRLTLEPEGSYELESHLGGVPMRVVGTWSMDGTVLTLTETHVNGVAQEAVLQTIGSRSGNTLRFDSPDGGTFTLRKR